MSEKDRIRWDAAYAGQDPGDEVPALPQVFSGRADLFPVAGSALDIACGTGRGAVWLAQRGLRVWGLDVSGVAIDRANALAERCGISDGCRFDVADLDEGLPPGPPVDVVLCHRFRDRRLDRALIERLSPGGLLAISALSEVGAAPGPYRTPPGELVAAFDELELIASGEGDGEAWLLARAR
ncbi:class I SAM-dependent methyltransferase [Mycolicibacterium setense]